MPSFEEFETGEEPAIDLPTYEILFRPKSDLYAKGNDATLLLRDLSRLGEMSIHCDMDDLPALDRMNPEAAYFAWKISLKTDKGEEAIRSVFEFAEWDCELEVMLAGDEAQAHEELPMQPVPFDLSMLDEEPRAPVEEEDRTVAESATFVNRLIPPRKGRRTSCR